MSFVSSLHHFTTSYVVLGLSGLSNLSQTDCPLYLLFSSAKATPTHLPKSRYGIQPFLTILVQPFLCYCNCSLTNPPTFKKLTQVTSLLCSKPTSPYIIWPLWTFRKLCPSCNGLFAVSQTCLCTSELAVVLCMEHFSPFPQISA